jgi:GxxExxY protein
LVDDSALTGQVIPCFRRVYNTLGPGLPERPYVRALAWECTNSGLLVEREAGITIHYNGVEIGRYRADLLVEGRLIIEAKACDLLPVHSRQVLTYLRCSRIETGLLLSFGEKPSIRRFVMQNDLKPGLALSTRERICSS